MRELAVTIVLLASTSVLAAEQWTEEEQTSGVKKVEYVRYAFAGQKMKLQLLSAMDMDCSIVEGWAFEIIKQPETWNCRNRAHYGLPELSEGKSAA